MSENRESDKDLALRALRELAGYADSESVRLSAAQSLLDHARREEEVQQVREWQERAMGQQMGTAGALGGVSQGTYGRTHQRGVW